MTPGAGIAAAIRARSSQGAPALIAYLTAGYPTKPAFEDALAQVSGVADVVEIGVPFSDPMADGLTIQRSSRAALEQGTTLEWTLGAIRACRPRLPAPLVLMSYLNPLLSYGPARLATDAARAGVGGVVIPDLPHEECAEMRSLLEDAGLALVQMVTPLTPPARLARLAAESRAFVYAVTRTGTTGDAVTAGVGLVEYLRRVRDASEWPVCAGFGIGSAAQVAALAGHADGCIVGSALVEALGQGRDVAQFLRSLRA
ncbi:MAG TPA: tryptophan synthase subunit alpha [Steroidobacteraceae bacterium]|nr:tryptophan synthase subunit alpha [Steroidobacteraceae bacterium]